MKVCITGGNGYIGIHTVYELVRQDHEVIVVSRTIDNKDKPLCKNVRFYQEDIMNKEKISEILGKENELGKIDVVMHFAGLLDAKESLEKPYEYYMINVLGTANVLKAMAENKIKNILFTSTSLVYGKLNESSWSENAKTSPINPYGETKLAAEKLIKWMCERYDMNYCIFRCFNVAGADESLDIGLSKKNSKFLVPSMVETALGLRDKPMTIMGNDYDTKDGTCIRDYVHIQDLADANILGAEYIMNNNKSVILNLGNGEGYTVLEMVKMVEKYHPINYQVGPGRPGDPAKIVANNEQIKKILKWTPKRNLDDIIRSDFEYRKKLNNIK